MDVSHQRRNGGEYGIISGESKKEKCLMGRVSAFLGMVLYMYPEKNGRHKRPHVHVLYGDEECVLSVVWVDPIR